MNTGKLNVVDYHDGPPLGVALLLDTRLVICS